MISTQVDPVTKVALPGVRPATKTDALYFLDPAYADAGTLGGNVFTRRPLQQSSNGVWGAVLYKDRMLRHENRAAAVVAHYKEWLPPWQRS